MIGGEEEKKAESEKGDEDEDLNTEDMMKEQKIYSNLAHTHQEEVTEQPSILIGGKLKSY